MRLAVIIPTRNRSELAVRAVESVVPQLGEDTIVIVSDNSTDARQAAELESFVQSLERPEVIYLRAPRDFAMHAHWEWVFFQPQAMGATHVTVLTDRMIFKRGAISRLRAEVRRHPSSIISYNHDRVDDYTVPVRLYAEPWTGKSIEIPSDILLNLSSQMKFHSALPRMLNCIAPRAHIDRLHAQFGNLFESVSPDFYFAYRTLSLVDTMIYLDVALLVHGSLARSNGASMSRGHRTADHADFVAKLGNTVVGPAAPVPEFETTGNACISEYEAVRRETGSPKFVPVDLDAYFAAIAGEIEAMDNPPLAERMRELLKKHRNSSTAPSEPKRGGFAGRLRTPGYALGSLLSLVVAANPTKQLWKWTGAKPPRTVFFRFGDPEEAFEFAQSPGRRRSRHHPELKFLTDGFRPAADKDSRRTGLPN